jgi:UDP-N-acetylmuramyl tripeptide synthase
VIRYWPALLLGRLARFAIRLVRKGGGSALPGLILSKLAPGILYKVLNSFSRGLVIVTGSAGKSTTTKMLVAIVREHGVQVFTNPSTANILQGFYSTIIERASWSGKIAGQVAILEMDEAHAEELTRKIAPLQVTVLNVMEDQLDRFVDPALVRADLALVAARATRSVLLNADDQNTLLIAKEITNVEPKFFGIASQVLANQARGLQTAPTYLDDLPRPIVMSEVTELEGAEAVLSGLWGSASFELPSRGVHFALDAVAAFESARVFLGESFDLAIAEKALSEVPPVFARGEMVEINGEEVEFILVQNPGSMQLNLDNLVGEPEQLLFAIGRDVHDPSWLWTVDYSNLKHVDVCTGFNAYEAALVLHYNDVPLGLVTDDLEQATDTFFGMPKPKQGHKTVVFSADAMRRMRRSLGFWSPDEVER